MANITIWKSIPGFEGLYQINIFGLIKSNYKSAIIMGSFDKDKYLQVSLSKNKVKKKFKIHRLVALTFHLNPENKPEVNHKDGIRFNPFYLNVEWNTTQENAIHSFKQLGRIGGRKGKKSYQPTRFKPIECLTNGKRYINIIEASKDLNIKVSSIRSAVNLYRGFYKKTKMFEYC